jgi:phospholipase DDHD1
LIVHGIGTIQEYQEQNLSNFTASVNKVQTEMFRESPYECVIRMIDWNSLLKSEQTKAKVQRVTIREMGVSDSYRGIINETCVDILFYLSKAYRPQILQRVADEARKYYDELHRGGQNKRFKGKVAVVAHSLGSVITYDLLLR